MKGVYLLLVQLTSDIDLKVGALGTRHLAEGYYVYVGSAQTNIEQRVSRHLKKEKRKFWHIDYLLDLTAAKIIKVLFKEADKTQECAVANKISELNETVVGFGCSDCNCKSHLFRAKKPDSIATKDMAELKLSNLNS